jgi:hypothetical protein
MKALLRLFSLTIIALVCRLAVSDAVAASTPEVEARRAADFAKPPAAARPWVYWMWMDGNLSREGITADLEAMRQAGIGGVIIMEVNVGIPEGLVKFMSPEWRQLFKHVIDEAKRLGLQVTLNAGPGWTGSGGPWVKPEQSMQHLVASALDITGPTNFAGPLPRPQRRPPFFGDGALPPELERAKNEFYRDVSVLAFPTPSGKQRIEDIDEKALYVRAPYSSQPGVKPFLPAPANFPMLPAGGAIDPARIVDLTEHLTADGRLNWEVPAGHWTIMRFGRTTTGANTRPAPKPGLGLECDKMDKAALDAHFDKFIGTLLREIGSPTNSAGAGWNYLHIDSWEMSSQNWTPAFREEFRRRRGYDMFPYLPAMSGRVVKSMEVSERFLWDLRQTAQELMIENHARHLQDLGRQHGFGLSIEPYDMMPCADMSFGAVADVPMCEFWLYGFNTTFSVFEAASIGHTCGGPIVAAESFTSTDQEHWQAYPAAMKSLGDWAFCSGVNRVVFHRYQHQPWLNQFPGMTMGPYGVHWERTETWWSMVPAYHKYLARCQYLLRQGLPVADICYLVAEGAPHVFRPPPSATHGNPPDHLGYNFDGCAPDTLVSRMSVKDGRLVLPDGMSYRVLVLPSQETMTPALLRKVRDLVLAGATVIGPRPVKSPSLADYPRCDAEVKQLADELWGTQTGPNPGSAERSSPHVIWRTEFDGTQAAASSRNPLEHAAWIWYPEGVPALQAPVGKRYFRRVFVLDTNRPVVSARVSLTADNAFELLVNGRQAAEGDNFTETYSTDVTSLLHLGTNFLAVVAQNGGDAPNPAGLIASLDIQFGDGRTLALATDRRWEACRSPAPGWTTDCAATNGWSPALELGPFEMAPWSLPTRAPQEPAQYCEFSLVTDVLAKMGVQPDFECAEAGSDVLTVGPQGSGSVRYVHRLDGDRELYFVANTENCALLATCTFRVADKQPELWDPLTGQTRVLPEFTSEGGRTSVPLRFEPNGSFFVVFGRAPLATVQVGTPRGGVRPEATTRTDANQPNKTRGRLGEASLPEQLPPPAKPSGANFPQVQAIAELAGSWEVSFDPKWGGPKQITFPALEDWSKRPEDGIRFYSGTATYRKRFDLPSSVGALYEPSGAGNSGAAGFKEEGRPRLLLELGDVKNLARVTLNGHALGVVWCPPWRVDITAAAQPRDNQLEVEVVNLWPNRLIGDEQFPADCSYNPGGNLARFPDWLLANKPRPSHDRFTFTTWKHFSKNDPLLPSGLLGPVKLWAEQAGR